MPNWNENEFVERAKALARAHVGSQKSINDLSEKVAREHALGPDEIRTLVRMTNVQVFGEKFAGMNGDDKNVVFDVGDPELVIHKIVNGVESSSTESANIYNDKLAGEIPNFMQEVRLGRAFDAPAQEKVAAADEDIVKAPRRDALILSSWKLAEDMDLERIAAGQRWETKLAALSTLLRKAHGYGKSFDALEKDAYATLGEEARPELEYLSHLRRQEVPAVDSEKIAHLQEYHDVRPSPELTLLKEAHEDRKNYVKFQKATEWVRANTPSL